MSANLPNRRSRELPMSAAAFRERLWEAAGVDLPTRAAALKEAFDMNRALMKAEKVELVTYEGAYQEVLVPDNAVRARACEAVFNLNGVVVGRQDSAQGSVGPVHIHINVPWFTPEAPTNITPKVETDEASSPTVIEQEPDATR